MPLSRARNCHYCKRELTRPTRPMKSTSATLDHVEPRSCGGEMTVPCCFTCNQMKGNMLPYYWMRFIKDNPEWWRMWPPQQQKVQHD